MSHRIRDLTGNDLLKRPSLLPQPLFVFCYLLFRYVHDPRAVLRKKGLL